MLFMFLSLSLFVKKLQRQSDALREDEREKHKGEISKLEKEHQKQLDRIVTGNTTKMRVRLFLTSALLPTQVTEIGLGALV